MKNMGNSFYMQKYGKSYFFATMFFPPALRKKVFTLYSFVRIPDLIVDDPNIADQDARQQLEDLYQQRNHVYHGKLFSDPQFGQIAEIFHEHKIPEQYARSFFDAMIMDTDVKKYESYQQLQTYMYGSAEVVWLMMCHLIWYSPEALDYAKKLGEAMQFTNFLRDVSEDFIDFGRVYMPLEMLQKHRLDHSSIEWFVMTKSVDTRWVNFMREAIDLADNLYQESIPGLDFLDPQGKKPVYLAARLYQEILRKIERNWYNVFGRSAKTSSRDKMKVVAKNIWK